MSGGLRDGSGKPWLQEWRGKTDGSGGDGSHVQALEEVRWKWAAELRVRAGEDDCGVAPRGVVGLPELADLKDAVELRQQVADVGGLHLEGFSRPAGASLEAPPHV